MHAGTGVMIVENEAIVALDLQDQLSAMGFEVTGIARTAAESLRAASASRPNLVKMDVNLADGADGIEAASALRASFNIPVIILTAFTDPATLNRANTSEAYGYLVKPFNPHELQAAIRMALFRHAAETERQRLTSELMETQARLKSELAAAAAYVISLVPPRIAAPVWIDWRFLPSGKLGGDCLGYHSLDPHRLAFYILDVSGHGIGPAMLAVSLMNIL
jgi:phosphoserine phosphatase RsbU/P